MLKEVARTKAASIVFIDEIHTMVGAGKAEGAMDAGNMLNQPALARGELHCMARPRWTSTASTSRRTPRWSGASRRCWWTSPAWKHTIAILRGLQEKYEVHHGVDITDPAIVAAAELSHRYITDRFLPDKAIDLIDEAAAKIKIEIDSKPEAHGQAGAPPDPAQDRARSREEEKRRSLAKSAWP